MRRGRSRCAEEQHIVGVIGHASPLSCSARGSLRGRFAGAACGLFLMSDPRHVLATAVAIDRALAGCAERLPGDAGGIVDPRLFGLGIAAGGLALLEDVAAGLTQPRIHLLQLIGVLDLYAEMIEAGLASARRDRE